MPPTPHPPHLGERSQPSEPSQPSQRRRRRLGLLTGVALTASLALAGCGGDDTGGGDPEEGKSGDVVQEPIRSPLTGIELKSAPRHPVIAVKIDNSSNSAPQVGLGGAGLVTEELVEGGITRLAVFYYGKVPDNVGPVRSMRATDIGVVQPLQAVLVASGGAAPTVERVADAGIKTFTEGATGFYRDSGRSAPYNLFMRLSDLAKTVRAKGSPSPAYLPFDPDAKLPKGEPASGLSASFSPRSTTVFERRDGGYVNTNSFAAAEDQFIADTVLVLRVEVGDAGYLDPAGNPVPETKFTGEGEAMVFHAGRVVTGTWAKDGLDAPVTLRAGGKELSLPPGKVWIELVPRDGGGVTVTR